MRSAQQKLISKSLRIFNKGRFYEYIIAIPHHGYVLGSLNTYDGFPMQDMCQWKRLKIPRSNQKPSIEGQTTQWPTVSSIE
jgi:hypothetical protein